MIEFKELYIASDYKSLIIDVGISEFEEYNNIRISEIYIDTKDTLEPSVSGPSNNTVYSKVFKDVWDIPEEGIYSDNNGKSIRLVLSSNAISAPLKGNIFYVWIVASPVEEGSDMKLGVAIDWKTIYSIGLKYVKDVNCGCTNKAPLIDFVLQYNAFKAAVQTGHYIEANKFFKKFFISNSIIFNHLNCKNNDI